MRILAILACMVATACASADGPNLTQVIQRCGYDSKPFVQAWPCVRSGFQEVDFYSDLKSVYIASGDFVSEQVTTGKMTDAEAKMAMAQVRQRNYDAAATRENANSTGRAIVAASILNRPNPFASSGPVMSAPSSMNCYRFGNSVQCN